MSDLRERIARAIHDGQNAQAQYEMSGIRPHTAEECEWFDQYLADADAVLKVLRDEAGENDE